MTKNLSAVLTFIDFNKAFDSIHRGILMKILRAYNVIPDAIVNLMDKFTLILRPKSSQQMD